MFLNRAHHLSIIPHTNCSRDAHIGAFFNYNFQNIYQAAVFENHKFEYLSILASYYPLQAYLPPVQPSSHFLSLWCWSSSRLGYFPIHVKNVCPDCSLTHTFLGKDVIEFSGEGDLRQHIFMPGG